MDQQKEIIEEIARHLGISSTDIEPQKLLREDLGLDPFTLRDLFNDLAAKFNIVFDPNDTEEVETVEDLIAMVEDLMIE